MQSQLTCPKCGNPNRPEARFCQSCGALLPVQPAGASQNSSQGGSPAPSGSVRGWLNKIPLPKISTDEIKTRAQALIQQIDDQLDSWLGGEAKTGQSPPAAPAQKVVNPAATATKARQRIPAWQPGTQIGNYLVVTAWELNRSNYYQAIPAACTNGHRITEVTSRCTQCQTELTRYFIHETITRQLSQPGLLSKWKDVSALNIPAVFRVIDYFEIPERRCLVTTYPAESWQSVFQIPLPINDVSLVVRFCLSLGQALSRLSSQGLVPNYPTLIELLESLLILQQRQNNHLPDIFYADLSYFGSAGYNAEQTLISHLGQILYVFTSGKYQPLSRAPADLIDISPAYRGIIEQVRRGQYASLSALMASIQGLTAVKNAADYSYIPTPVMRSLRQVAGYATHPGRTRKNNEDFVGKYSLGMQQTADMPEVGLYLVADGMGGHQAGEMASKEVVRDILSQVQVKVQALQAVPQIQRATVKLDETITPGDVLVSAIQNANSLLFRARQAAGSDRGTTITAVLIVGELCAVSNVGDSRTYRLRQGKLEQITQDHSLVAALVSSGVIKPEEVRRHPQRNTIWRSLGNGPTVEVDIFQRVLASGDRLLLCSDGLWEMVLDAEIEQIVRQAASPQVACDQLIDAANRAGGDDNISVIVVWIE
jgi:serine/threonine protein phosphatase PrpC